MSVFAIFHEQFMVFARFDYPAILHNENPVRVFCSRQTMRNNDYSMLIGHLIDQLIQIVFTNRI